MSNNAPDSRQPFSLIPQTVYVGDRAMLTLSYNGGAVSGGGQTGKAALVSLDAKNFPHAENIDFHRIALERRASGGRLLVEFSVYTPGILELPPIEIGGERFSGITVEISSILGSGEAAQVLSGPAPPLAIPGTGLLVYGTMGALIFVSLVFLLTALWGRRRLAAWIQKWKRRRLAVLMRVLEKRLRRKLQKEGKCREIIDALSAEFRVFLSFSSGIDCRAMTPAEFIPSFRRAADTSGECPPVLSCGQWLERYFRRCDALRFSGGEIGSAEAAALLGDMRTFVDRLDRAERNELRITEDAA